MLFKDFFFSFKNIHVSFLEKKKISKFIKIGISTLYKFFILELIINNFFYKKDLDIISIKKKELFNKDLNFLFEHFGSLRQQHNYADFFQENLIITIDNRSKWRLKKNINYLNISISIFV